MINTAVLAPMTARGAKLVPLQARGAVVGIQVVLLKDIETDCT